MAAGAKHDKAKEFNNVMAPHSFDIPISQVNKATNKLHCLIPPILGQSSRIAHDLGNLLPVFHLTRG